MRPKFFFAYFEFLGIEENHPWAHIFPLAGDPFSCCWRCQLQLHWKLHHEPMADKQHSMSSTLQMVRTKIIEHLKEKSYPLEER